jgi:hypothetical protein
MSPRERKFFFLSVRNKNVFFRRHTCRIFLVEGVRAFSRFLCTNTANITAKREANKQNEKMRESTAKPTERGVVELVPLLDHR